MSALSLAVRDSSTMLRRNLLHARRYPSLTLNLLLTPVMLLLLFVYIFGDVMSAGIGGGGADRSDYIAYIVPGILMMTIGGTVIGTAVSVSTDMNEGIIARFRTMAIHRGSVLIGHVIGSVLQCIASVVLVGAVAVAIGFRSTDATALEWLAAFGLLALFSLALTWIAVGMGMASPNAEAAGQQRAAADPAAAHLQRLHPGRHDAGLVPADRRVPAVHTRHRDPARAAARQRDRQQRVDRGRLVPGARGARLLLVGRDVQPRPEVTAMTAAGRLQQLVPPEGGVLRHRVGVRRPVRVIGRRRRARHGEPAQAGDGRLVRRRGQRARHRLRAGVLRRAATARPDCPLRAPDAPSVSGGRGRRRGPCLGRSSTCSPAW